MTSIPTAELTPEEAATLEAEIARMIDEMDTLRAIMERDQAEIERLKAESDHLKQRAQVVQAATRSVLAQLKAE